MADTKRIGEAVGNLENVQLIRSLGEETRSNGSNNASMEAFGPGEIIVDGEQFRHRFGEARNAKIDKITTQKPM